MAKNTQNIKKYFLAIIYSVDLDNEISPLSF